MTLSKPTPYQIRSRGTRKAEPLVVVSHDCKLPHVLHSFIGGTTGNVDSALAAVSRRRLVAVSMPHFFSIAETVARSEMIATFPERMALRLAPILGLRVYEVPIELAPISLALIWHRRNDEDVGCTWFRRQVIQFAKSLG